MKSRPCQRWRSQETTSVTTSGVVLTPSRLVPGCRNVGSTFCQHSPPLGPTHPPARPESPPPSGGPCHQRTWISSAGPKMHPALCPRRRLRSVVFIFPAPGYKGDDGGREKLTPVPTDDIWHAASGAEHLGQSTWPTTSAEDAAVAVIMASSCLWRLRLPAPLSSVAGSFFFLFLMFTLTGGFARRRHGQGRVPPQQRSRRTSFRRGARCLVQPHRSSARRRRRRWDGTPMATPSQGATGVLREARAPQFLSEDEEKDLFYLGEPSRNFQNLGNAMSFIILPD